MPVNNFNYVTDVPDGPDDPSDDQPDMKINTNSIPLLIGVDHVTFGVNKGGIHNQVTFPAVSVAPGLGDGDAVEFVQNFSTPGGFGVKAWPVWKNDPLIGNIPLIIGYPIPTANGVTYLPGGIILQWGTIVNAASQTATPVTFTGGGGVGVVDFPNNNFGVWGNMQNNSASNSVNSIYLFSFSTTGFSYRNTSSSLQTFNWIAIGN